MPEDKDFKRIVRARMDDTGERYTTARAGLRPADGEPAFPATVVPMDRAGLQAWRRDRPRPSMDGPPPATFGPCWELTVDAGGEVEHLDPPVAETAMVAALGRALGGVGFVRIGMVLDVPAPEGTDPDDPKPPPMDQRRARLKPFQRAHEEFSRLLAEHHAILLGRPSALHVGRAVRRDATVVIPGGTETTVLLGDDDPGEHLGARVEPATWINTPGLPGRPWVSYGVVLHVEHDFPVAQFPTSPPPGFTGPFRLGPVVDGRFWDDVGRVVAATARRCGLPGWPLHDGWLHDPANMQSERHTWQQPDG